MTKTSARCSPGMVAHTCLQRMEKERVIWYNPIAQQPTYNGANTFDCSAVSDQSDVYVDKGRKFQTVFEPGRMYLIRLINVATDSRFQFSIDGHKLGVIANYFVPIKRYNTDSLVIDASTLRASWMGGRASTANDNPEDSTSIVRYDAPNTSNPTSVSIVEAPTVGMDEPLESLGPHMNLDVTNIASTTLEEPRLRLTYGGLFTWTINSSSLVLGWTNSTLKRVSHNESVLPTKYNIVVVDIN